jgi:aryl-alcohol dehydrogenase-like predicted oxidoreductase
VEDLDEKDFRRRGPRFQEENLRRNLDLVMEVESLAAEKGVTSSQLALAWVLSRGDDIVPIPGTKRRTYLEENAAAAEVELTAAELERLEQAFPAGAAAGDRYPDMSTVNR